jgi:hypothetical protein
LQLKSGTPQEIIDALTPFGHIAIAPGRIDVAQVGDNLLTQARYVGVFRGGKVAGEEFSLEGSGMPFWLGDEDGKGPIIESVSASAATFAQTINLVLPAAIGAGTIYSVAGSTTHTFQWQTAKSALNWIANAYSTPTVPVSWRVNGDATLDAGPDVQLFNLTPDSILVKKDAVLRTGRGFDVVGISGDLQLESVYADYTTKVIVLGAGEGDATIAASATLAASAIPYNDMRGNKVAFTRLVDDLDADGTAIAPALAASLLSRFDSPAYGATLSSDDFDVRGDFSVGDHVAVFAPSIGFVDYSHEMYYEGVPINPMYLQVQGLTWPVEEGFTVGFRTMAGTWYDLSTYYKPSSGQTLIDVGDNPSGLTSLGFDIDRSRVVADASVPATPVFGTFYSSNYLNDQGETRSQVLVTWTEPDNTDGSTIIDGDHYEIRYRPLTTMPYPATWGEAAQDTWDELFTWQQPRVPAFTTDEWQVVQAPFETEQYMVLGLLPSVVYEFQIRAVDHANPPNRSAWSASQAFTAARDTLPPAQPAAPVVAASRLALQVLHYLGANAGGTFNLDRDLQLLEIHASTDPYFFPDDSTLLGRLQAGAALASQVPVVATFQVEDTIDLYVRVVAVDREGNRSNASPVAQSSALLIDDAHISDLTVSKITAGTISADWILAAAIKTGASGERLELNADGLQAYDDDGELSTNLSSTPSDTAEFISFRRNGDTLSSITADGVGTFQKVYANSIYLGGDSIYDKFVYEPPRGILAFGSSSSDVEGRGIDQNRGYIELAFDAEDGRAYRVHYSIECESTSAAAGERYVVDVLDGGSGIPDTASTNIGGGAFTATLDAGRNTTCAAPIFLRCPVDIAAGTHRLLIVFRATEGVATVRGTDGPALFWVEDVGPSDWFENNAVINDGGFLGAGAGGGVSSVPKNATAIKSYTVVYTSTWHGVYDNSSNALDVGFAYQGDWDLDNGTNHKTLLGFPPTMPTALSGATVADARLTMYANGWRESNGTAVIGYHNHVDKPSTWTAGGHTVVADVQRKDDWPKIGAVTVLLNSTFKTALAAGNALGIAVGPAPSLANVYAGRFDSDTSGTHPATLRIVYTK